MQTIHHLLGTKFYESCAKHGKAETWICKDCLSDPFCENCLQDSDSKHRGHRVLQIFKASRKEVIRVNDINRFWNVSDIQPFMINSKVVVYLHERNTKGDPKCRICGGHKLEEKYAFCSIQCQCQVESNIDSNLDLPFAGRDESVKSGVASSSPYDKAVSLGNSSPVAKHRRKGQPRRAPLF